MAHSSSREKLSIGFAVLLCAILVAPSFLYAQTPTTRPRATTRARRTRPQGPSRGDFMDYGPFISCSVLRPRTPGATSQDDGAVKTDGGELLAVRGIVIHVGNNATVCFDTDLMSLAGGWTSGFLDLSRTNLGQYKGDFPTRVKGNLQFSTLTDPGWADDGKFADPRKDRIGPLPKEWAHYKGLYRDGEHVVLSYDVGSMGVLEMDSSVSKDGQVAFTRTLHVDPSDKPQKILICEVADVTSRDTGSNSSQASSTQTVRLVHDRDGTNVGLIRAPNDTKLESNGNRIEVTLPAHSQAESFKIVICRLPTGMQSIFGELMRSASKVEDLPSMRNGGPPLWKQTVVTHGELGSANWAYTVDNVEIPEQNPWKAWMRTSAFDFFPDGRAAIATFSGDVWIVSGLNDKLDHVTWKRYAAGLYEPLGLKIVDNQVYVLGRDQITILHDLNHDGEADFYENFCNAWPASPIYHAFLMDLQADSEGNFYFSSCGNQAPMDYRLATYGYIIKVPKYGGTYERYANGLRAANGLGMGPHDELVTADNQGNWTPVCRINLVKKGGFYGFYYDPRRIKEAQKPELGLPDMYDPPICWIKYPAPDNSSGGQVWGGQNWGPLSGMMLSTSYGQSDLLEVLWEQLPDGTPQGGTLKLPLKFGSGIMRARVNPKDGQVWVVGLKGWQTNAVHDGTLQRVRYTGKPAHLPVAMHVGKDSISLTFSDPLDRATAADDQNYGIEQWNYHWTQVYGSKEYKVSAPSEQGHDDVDVKSAKLSADGKTVTLMIGEVKPVMQMDIQMHIKAADGSPIDWEISNTINKAPPQ